MLPDLFLEGLSAQFPSLGRITHQGELKGGDICRAHCLRSDEGNYFLKLIEAESYPGMFEAEALALETLAEHSKFRLPRVLGHGVLNGKAYLLLEFVPAGVPGEHFWSDFGANLAHLHQQSNASFGWERENFIGALPQVNDQADSWSEFYLESRLEPQIERAYNAGLLAVNVGRQLERLAAKMENLWPAEPPALLHGDLWSGNFLVGPAGEAVLFDPASYYGHREMDLAMMKLFGGFSEGLFASYEEHYPLETNWQDRLDLGQLYPLLVHFNLFGSAYRRRVEEVLRRYAG